MDTSATVLGLILPILIIVFYFLIAVLGVYCLILFIKLAHRGIKALDIYIAEKNRRNL
ncbi:hypothetical protein M3201_00520 [Paenibacillus motobuensis]|uniref:hypothetical protein n=1 Tax=Paenibacillus TaxID=44249 RepID=UPI00203CBB7F|nr:MULTISPECIES: hypothetical protein [Paenibacillus]MCM3038187.1 hypothetical protein [Paenibacillus lutimineralis]MCM3645291.1 hypothetical protein [Paenibacillus motobuensis]